MRWVLDVIEEPSGELLRRLISALAQHSSSVMMVLRDELGLSETGQALLTRLHPHLLKRERRSSWPGTTLLGEEATVLRFALGTKVLEELLAASNSLFGWQQPELPEDLALLRADETVVLGSISHEHDAYLDINDEEYQSLVATVPEMRQIMRPHEA